VLVFTFLAQKIFCQLSLRKRADAACSPLFFPQRNLGWACLLYLHRSPLYICMVVPTLCYTSSLPLQFQKRPRRSMPPCMHLVQQTHREESSTAFSIDRSIRVPLLFSFFFPCKIKVEPLANRANAIALFTLSTSTNFSIKMPLSVSSAA
jgi:hypothetical protein